jgi:site-specific recombinase XerD
MRKYNDCPQILKEFLVYHETIKGQSPLTISEYYLDLRMFLRFIKLMRNDMPINTPLDTINIRNVDLAFLGSIETSDVFDFLSYLANDRTYITEGGTENAGISPTSRSRKLSAIKSFFKYLIMIISFLP